VPDALLGLPRELLLAGPPLFEPLHRRQKLYSFWLAE
jgi:hypothetical protein